MTLLLLWLTAAVLAAWAWSWYAKRRRARRAVARLLNLAGQLAQARAMVPDSAPVDPITLDRLRRRALGGRDRGEDRWPA